MIGMTHAKQWERIARRLEALYPSAKDSMLSRLEFTLGRYLDPDEPAQIIQERWDQSDAMLIAYGDSIQSDETSRLSALRRFANERLRDAFSTIHILPFYPYSSDDGFSVIDYRAVDPALGSWKDVEALSKEFDLMFDFVLNHVSAKSEWFDYYTETVAPYRDYFIEVDPSTDVSLITRPRTSPLLTPVNTREGTRYVWTTFSADQVDLNWEEPNVFFEMVDILLSYISRGARFVRLDAVAFLWKKLGTTCLHLPETHEMVKLLRDIAEIVSPQAIILTETNVPHEENISYFGEGDEAHIIYQFSLPPLLLHGLLNGTAKTLTQWATSLEPAPEGCCFFNFTASHDGVGVRPLQGILPDVEIDRLAEIVKNKGGHVSCRTRPDGGESPYELNITYYSALADINDPRSALSQDRFFASQAIMLAMQGLPGVYIHSVFGSLNDEDGVKETGIPRRINRRKFRERELDSILSDPECHGNRVYQRYCELLKIRRRHSAFHPNAPQKVFNLDDRVFALRRGIPNSQRNLVCFTNFTNTTLETPVGDALEKRHRKDLISGREVSATSENVTLRPYETLWLA